jgi:hypothetical protein
MPTFLVHAGLLVALVGLISALIPLRFVGLRSRGAGLLLMLAGVSIFVVGMALPVRITRVATARKALDLHMPAYQARELHSVRVRAAPERVAEAIRSVTALDIRSFATLNRIRNPHARGSHDLLGKRMCDVLHRAGFVTLEESGTDDLVLGVAGRFWGGLQGGDRSLDLRGAPRFGSSARLLSAEEFARFHRPGYAKAAIDFRIEDLGGGWSRLSTETRAIGTDARARREFERYWRLIAPGSAWIRREWLDAIKRVAEGPARG